MNYPSVGTPEGLTSAVVDTPIYDRVLLRLVRRLVGLGADEQVQDEFDDGNGMSVVTGVSPCGQKKSVVTIPCP